MEESVSKKITIISLLSMIMVIYIHSFNIASPAGKSFFQPENTLSTINIFLQYFISQGVARIAVPLFFVMSGFLFFNHFSMKTYKQKVIKRFYTLFIPYLFWSFLAVFIYFVLQSIPGVQHFFTNELIINRTFPELLYITWVNPRNIPLWFMRDLMFLVVLSPVVFYLIKYQSKPYFIIIIILWFIIDQKPAPFSYYKAEPVFFFSLGAYISLLNNSILSFKLNNKYFLGLFTVYLVLLLIKTCMITLQTIHLDITILLLHKFSILIGVVLLWFLLDRYLMDNKTLIFLSKFTFLYFVFHEPGLMILQKGLYSILGKALLVSITSYILLPIFMIFFLTFLGIAMKKFMPNTTAALTGNRL